MSTELKVSLEPVPMTRLKLYIKRAFEGDKDLKKYHSKPANYPFSMEHHTYERIYKEHRQSYFLKAFAVLLNDKNETTIIGFTVLYPKEECPMLYSFGIRQEYRKWDVLNKWLESVKKEMPNGEFVMVLMKKNKRAISFFQRNGMEIIKKDKKKKTVALCPKVDAQDN